MAEEKAPEAKNPTKWGLIISLFFVQILLAVVLVYFLILPRLSPASSNNSTKEEIAKTESKEPGILVTIDNLTINPKGSYGRRYAVFEVALEVPDEDAKKEINELRTILPICSKCKKIRTDEGYWEQLEEYLAKHNDVYFSHSYCPSCAKEIMDEIDKEK